MTNTTESASRDVNTAPAGRSNGPALGDAELRRLRVFNAAAGLLHLLSAVAVLLLNNGFRIGISDFWLNGPPGSPVEDGIITQAFTYPLAVAVAAFLLLSAFFHFLVAFPMAEQYRRELSATRNRFRWVEYSMSATLMIVTIATITGISDFTPRVEPPHSRIRRHARLRPLTFTFSVGFGPEIGPDLTAIGDEADLGRIRAISAVTHSNDLGSSTESSCRCSCCSIASP